MEHTFLVFNRLDIKEGKNGESNGFSSNVMASFYLYNLLHCGFVFHHPVAFKIHSWVVDIYRGIHTHCTRFKKKETEFFFHKVTIRRLWAWLCDLRKYMQKYTFCFVFWKHKLKISHQKMSLDHLSQTRLTVTFLCWFHFYVSDWPPR